MNERAPHSPQTLALQPTSASVAQARHWTVAQLSDHLGADHPAVERARLCVSELATNAIVHGGDAARRDCVTVSWTCDQTGEDCSSATTSEAMPGCVRVEVTADSDGPSRPHLATPHPIEPPGEHGRGLALVRAYAAAWGWEDRPQGRLTTWFDLPADPAAPLYTALDPERAFALGSE
ncbi:ATP-binding protein [Actinomadura harenae]|uniref:ATP-binding protein n=1 Tax=Actinomadura harenae TaxID=2483351 RepID=A0A3M2LXN8_9ACTN|nr:ATP-binding protein [Actinomadura harenae]RMI42097.1 ATP-binding protein [Actinomadura harenae]